MAQLPAAQRTQRGVPRRQQTAAEGEVAAVVAVALCSKRDARVACPCEGTQRGSHDASGTWQAKKTGAWPGQHAPADTMLRVLVQQRQQQALELGAHAELRIRCWQREVASCD